MVATNSFDDCVEYAEICAVTVFVRAILLKPSSAHSLFTSWMKSKRIAKASASCVACTGLVEQLLRATHGSIDIK